MKEFLKDMLSDGQNVSSKRVCGFLTLICLLIIEFMVVIYLWKNKMLEQHLLTIFGSLIALVCTFFGLTLTENPWVK